MAYYAVASILCALAVSFSVTSALTEENVQITLYVERPVSEGANRTAITSVDAGGFGSIYMSDRSIADGSGLNANMAGRAQAVYFKSSAAPTPNKWTISMTLVFEGTSRFSGSTLEVAGIDLGKDCDWSIVGGTGKFTLARGVVHRKFINVPDSRMHEELKINAYYTPINSMRVSF